MSLKKDLTIVKWLVCKKNALKCKVEKAVIFVLNIKTINYAILMLTLLTLFGNPVYSHAGI